MAKKLVIIADDDAAVHLVDLLEQQQRKDGDVQIQSVEDITFWVHKRSVQQAYGGSEEGGWWYDQYDPLSPDDPDYEAPVEWTTEELAYEYCRVRNGQEKLRREGLQYQYTSVLSYRDTYYSYTVTNSPEAERTPTSRPHYE